MARKKSLALAAAAMLGLLCAPQTFAANADTVYTNGKIYTMDDLKSGSTYDFGKVKDLDSSKLRSVEVVAVKDGKIVFAGSRAEAQAQGMLAGAKTIDLQGRAMLPAFVDGHGHFPVQGTDDLYRVFLGSPPLGTMTSIDDYVKALNTACENAKPGDGVVGTGYDDTLITDMRHPTWEDIEGAPACAGKDVRLSHISGHVAVVSKSLLIKAGLMESDGTPTQLAKDTPGVVINNGKVTGVLMETVAMGSVGSPTVTEDSKKALARANDVYLAKGVAMADAGGAMLMGGSAANVQMQQGLDDGDLTMRVNIHPILNAQYGGAGNLLSCYWQGLPADIEAPAMATSQQMVDSGFHPTEQSPKTGDDITKKTFLFTANYTPPSTLPDNYLFMGAYKILGDGSPQAYTAWMKDPGNYDWGEYTANDRFALYGNVDGHSPIYGTKYDTTKDSAAPTPPPYFNGLPGTVNVYPVDLQNLLEVVHRAGHSSEIHTNGSAYAEAWIEALEMTISKHPDITDTRHTSIHAQTFERNILERMAGRYADVDKSMTTQLFGALGQADAGQPGTVFDSAAVNGMTEAQLSQAMKAQNLFANFFITHTYFYGERHRDIFFGPGRANNISPTGWATALSVPFAFHNDTDVTPIDPLQSVESAVTRLSAKSLVSPGGQEINGTGHDINATVTYPSRKDANGPIPGSEMKFYNYDQRLNVAQAMMGVTIGPMYQNKIDHLTGSIATGKFADFVILDDDPIAIGDREPVKLSDIRVTTTIVDGKPAYGLLPGSTEYYFNVRPSYAPDPALADAQITNVKTAALESSQLRAMAREEQTRYAAFDVSGDVSGASVATMQMHILGNGVPASEFALYDGDANAIYGKSAEANHFWICANNDPMTVLPASQRLNMNQDYIVNFTVPADANGAFARQVELVSSGPAPTNRSTVASGWTNSGGYYDDDDSSGCTVGDKPAYDFAILAAALAALFGLNLLRRRSARG
ncbi:MAG: amidohydrolase family protein [Desulfovibrio sp.]|nr:amidohydrolase family protein [Desulfovibrio sp.]